MGLDAQCSSAQEDCPVRGRSVKGLICASTIRLSLSCKEDEHRVTFQQRKEVTVRENNAL